jgi:hypothetical protein
MIEIPHQALHPPQIAGQDFAGLGGLEGGFAADVSHDPGKGNCIESRPLRDSFYQLDVVFGRMRAV